MQGLPRRMTCQASTGTHSPVRGGAGSTQPVALGSTQRGPRNLRRAGDRRRRSFSRGGKGGSASRSVVSCYAWLL